VKTPKGQAFLRADRTEGSSMTITTFPGTSGESGMKPEKREEKDYNNEKVSEKNQ